MVKRRKEGFTNFMQSVLQNSMLTGIPQIAAAGNAPKKIVRCVVFVMCLVGFVYQSFIFMNMYWEYKTVIDVQVESPKVIDLPALTVCNYNGFLQTKICAVPEYKEEGCFNLTKKNPDRAFWCKCYPRFCDDGKEIPLVPTQQFIRDLAFIPYEKYKPYLQKFEQFFLFCNLVMSDSKEMYFPCNVTNPISIRCPNDKHYNMNVCFSLHTIIGQPDEKPQQVFSTGFSNILIDPMVYEYGAHLNRETIQVTFHNSRAIQNPYEYGFTLNAATKNVFRLKKTVKNLLPPPYETNCQDYLEEWKARGGVGPTNEKECIDECKVNVSMKAYGCVSSMFIPPSNMPRCRGITGNGDNPLDITSLVMSCAEKNCKPACYEETYQVTKDTQDLEDFPDCDKTWVGERSDQFIVLQVNFDGMETTTYSYSPKYQNIETFSYLGGYVGMWLGISLVAVFDFLETVILMARYPFRRCLAYKNKRQKITHLQTMQRNL